MAKTCCKSWATLGEFCCKSWATGVKFCCKSWARNKFGQNPSLDSAQIYLFNSHSIAETIWMFFSCIISSLDVVKAIKVSLSQCKAAHLLGA